MARIEERGARFRNNADIRKTRGFQQGGVLLPPPLAPAGRTADNRPRHLCHQRGLCARQFGDDALRKRAHVARRRGIDQIARLKAHLRFRRAVHDAGGFADHDASVFYADGGKQARLAA